MLLNAGSWGYKIIFTLVCSSFVPISMAMASIEESEHEPVPLPLAASWNIGKYKPDEGYNSGTRFHHTLCLGWLFSILLCE